MKHRWCLVASLLFAACSSAPQNPPGDAAVDAAVETMADAPLESGPDGAADAPVEGPVDASDAPQPRDGDPGGDVRGDGAMQNTDAGTDGGAGGFSACGPQPTVYTKPPPPPAVCGNGLVETGESCDPPTPLPNHDNAACLPSCLRPTSCAVCETQQTGRSCRDFPTAYPACEALLQCLGRFILDQPVAGSVGIVDAEYAYCDRSDSASCKAGGGAGRCKPEFEAAAGTADSATILAAMRDPTTPVGTAVVLIGAGYASPCGTNTSGDCFSWSRKPRRTEPTPCVSGCAAPTTLAPGPACANPAAPMIWTEQPPTSAALKSFWSAGQDDAWKKLYNATTMEHWNGTAWSAAIPPWGLLQAPTWGRDLANLWFRLGEYGEDLAWWNGSTWRIVLSQTVTNLIPVGKTGAWLVADGRLFEWDGVRGLLQERTPLPGRRFALVNIGVAASNDVWAFISDPTVTSKPEIWRWDGASWHPQAVPALRGGEWSSWVGPGPEVWLATDVEGDRTVRADLWHFDGTSWSKRENLAGVRNTSGSFFGTSGSDLWAQGDADGMLAHFDGTRWTRVPASLGGFEALAPDGPGRIWSLLRDGRLIRLHPDCAGAGSNLTKTPPNPVGGNYDWTFDPGTYDSKHAMQAFAADDVWDVSPGYVRRWDGATWNVLLRRAWCSTPINTLTSLWGSGPNDVWVGAQMGLLRWDGTAWRDVAVPLPPGDVSFEISAVWGSSRDDVWVVRKGSASGSTPLHWDGSRWTERPIARVPLPEGDGTGPVFIGDLWGAGPNDLWAFGKVIDLEPTHGPGGAGAAFVHWDGTAWTAVGDLGSAAFRFRTVGSPWGTAANDIWALGSAAPSAATDGGAAAVPERQLWHFDGVSWTVKEEKTSVTAVWGSGKTDVWFAAGASLRHADGTTATTIDLGQAPYLAGVSFGARHVWVVSNRTFAHGTGK